MRQVPDAIARSGRIGEQAADVSGLAYNSPIRMLPLIRMPSR